MAYNESYINVSPATVFAVLSEPRLLRGFGGGNAEASWCRRTFPGRRITVSSSGRVPPLVLNDHTEVLENEPSSRLVLRAKTRPFGTARVDLRLRAEGAGTRVCMTEVAGDSPSRLLFNRLSDPLIHARNGRSLQRLRRIAEQRG